MVVSVSRETNLIDRLKELNYYNGKFEQLRGYLRQMGNYEFVGDFRSPRQAIDIDNIKLDSELLKDYVENELIKLRIEKARVYQELGEYVEVDVDE